MTTLLRPAAFIAAVMLGLFGLVAAPMSVQAETVVNVAPPLCDFVGPACSGFCFIGKCTIKFHTISVPVYTYLPLEERYIVTYILRDNGASCDCI